VIAKRLRSPADDYHFIMHHLGECLDELQSQL
jgi:hypothetical protein